MRFPMCDAMTLEQIAMNRAAQQDLIRGKYYRFDPPVTATGVPTGGPNTCALEEVQFDRGWYLGLVDRNHVFQGKPINDPRVIPVPSGYEDAPSLDQILEQLRDCYFYVVFIGRNASVAVFDPDQSHG